MGLIPEGLSKLFKRGGASEQVPAQSVGGAMPPSVEVQQPSTTPTPIRSDVNMAPAPKSPVATPNSTDILKAA